MPTGRSGIRFMAYLDTRKNRISVAIRLSGKTAQAKHAELSKQKADLNAEAGEALEWRDTPGTLTSYIALATKADPTNRTEWATQHEWMGDRLLKLYEVFKLRLDIGPVDLSDTGRLQQEFWTALRDRLLERNSIVKPRTPPLAHWTTFAVGTSHFELIAAISIREKRVGVALGCYGPKHKENFHQIEADKKAIEQVIGHDLLWEELPGKKQSRIRLRRENVDPTDHSQWPDLQEWLMEALEGFHKAFAPRVKQFGTSGTE